MNKLYVIFATLLVLSIFQFAQASESSHGEKKGHTLHLLYEQPAVDESVVTAPAKAELVTPTNRSTVDTSAKLSWKTTAQADGYHVQLASDPNFKWLLFDDRNFKGTEVALSGLNLEAGKHYFWRVAGIKTGNDNGYVKGPYTVSTFSVK